MKTPVSIVIPVHDEVESVGAVINEIFALPDVDAQVIVVDDASVDGTWDLLARDARVEAVQLRRRSGKSAALSAGIARAKHGIVVMLDGDGQDVPRELTKLLAALAAGKDVVGGCRAARRDTVTKRASSRVFNMVVGAVTGVHMRDHNTGLKVATRACLEEIPLHGDLHRFIYVLAHHRGFRVGEVEVEHRARGKGRSKYGSLRAITSLADLLLVRAYIALDGRAHRVLALLGLLALVAGGLSLAYLSATWLGAHAGLITGYVPLVRRPLFLFSVAAALLGTQALAIAYVAALFSARERPRPSVSTSTSSRDIPSA